MSQKVNKALIVILLLALVVRGIFFVALWHNSGFSEEKILGGDADDYHALALNLIEKGKFSIDGVTLDTRRTPLYPLFIGTIYSLFGAKPWIVFGSQVLLDVITCLLIYFLVLIIFINKKTALIAGLLYALEPLSAIYSVQLLTDIPFVFIFVLSLLILFLAIKRKRIFLFGLAGLILGLAILTRPIAQYFPLIAIVATFLLIKNKPIFYKLKVSIIFLFVLELALLPWQLRNFINFKSFDLTSMQGYNLIHYNIAHTEFNINKISGKEAIEKLAKLSPDQESLNEFKKSKIYQKIALNYIKEHPKDYLIMHSRGTLNMFIGSDRYQLMKIFGLKRRTQGNPDDIPLSESIVNRLKRLIATAKNEYYLAFSLPLLALFEYLLALIGLISLFLKKNWKLAIIFIGIIAYYALLTGVVGEARYKLPVIPFYLMLSAYGIFFIRELLRKTSKVTRT